MTAYAILLPGDEDRWAAASPEQRTEMYALHGQFATALAERGHKVVGGAELTHSRETKVVRGTLDNVLVTDGPYAEAAEQLTGFYLIESDDLDDLMNVCGLLSGAEAIEVRACVPAAG